ncbi:GIY-YIG nuclease family protein [Viscerimonas tarda]
MNKKIILIKNPFTDKYNLEYCIYYEEIPCLDLAIKREKELKGWNRAKKEALINKKNPGWKALVTENGFVRDSSPSPQNNECHSERSEVSSEKCLRVTDEILRYAQNDVVDNNNVREEGGGSAATFLSPSPQNDECHSERSEESSQRRTIFSNL